MSFKTYKNTLKNNKDIAQKNLNLVDAELKLFKKNQDLEKYIELNIELEQFAHLASHDIKSPQRTISSFLGLLEKKMQSRLTTQDKEYFEVINRNTKRLNSLVDDLLEYTQLGSQSINLSRFSSKELIDEVLESLEFNIKKLDATIINNSKDLMLLADKIKIRQILQNLIDNALKFIDPKRAPVVTLSNWEDDDYVFFSVKDNGIGISEKFYNKVFEKFAQLNPKDRYEGTGLGLSLCNEYIHKHGGKLQITRNPDFGVSFIFSIKKRK